MSTRLGRKVSPSGRRDWPRLNKETIMNTTESVDSLYPSEARGKALGLDNRGRERIPSPAVECPAAKVAPIPISEPRFPNCPVAGLV
jgi:hypothetical protein